MFNCAFFDLDKIAISNNYYKRIIYTIPDKFQIIVMSVSENVPGEIHEDVVQYIHISDGFGTITIEDMEYELYSGISVVVPPGAYHSILNTGTFPLKLYSIYTSDKH